MGVCFSWFVFRSSGSRFPCSPSRLVRAEKQAEVDPGQGHQPRVWIMRSRRVASACPCGDTRQCYLHVNVLVIQNKVDGRHRHAGECFIYAQRRRLGASHSLCYWICRNHFSPQWKVHSISSWGNQYCYTLIHLSQVLLRGCSADPGTAWHTVLPQWVQSDGLSSISKG